jgi:hypothetical protein
LGTPSSGTLTNCTGLPNAGLVNSSVTIGGTAIALGASSSTITNDLSISGLTVGKGGGSQSNNTTVGASALASNTTGGANTALGESALPSNTTADANTAIGQQSLYSNTTGAYNTAVGRQSLRANTTASNNTAVGYQAGYTGTTGTYNTSLGYQALYSNSTGASNVAIGEEALKANTAGDNTAVGAGALFANTSGTANCGIGRVALSGNTTGSYNTAVGQSAGSANTTDSNNTYIGYSCGSSVTGAGNVMFGPSSFSGYSGSNQVACKVGNGREAFYADLGSGTSFRQYSNSASWATTSDQRVKENIVEITDGLEKIVALRPVTFDYITSKEHNAGFIAQEFQNVLPDQVKLVKARPEEAELVGEDEIYSIQQNLTPYLVKAIQELKAEFDAYKATHP